MNYIYILKCGDGSFYTGWTTAPAKRVALHNKGKGAKYTRSRLPVCLVYTESFATKSEALKREYAVKKLSHEDKKKLTEKQ